MTTPQIELTDPDGQRVVFADLAADPLVVILVRYYGCLPCQAYVQDVADSLDRFPDSARVVAVGGSADFQARWMRDEKRIHLPLLLDPEQHVRDLANMGNLSAGQFLKFSGARSYATAMVRGLRPQRITRDTVRSPGIALFDRDLSLVWSHEGRALGDYPAIDELVATVAVHARG